MLQTQTWQTLLLVNVLQINQRCLEMRRVDVCSTYLICNTGLYTVRVTMFSSYPCGNLQGWLCFTNSCVHASNLYSLCCIHVMVYKWQLCHAAQQRCSMHVKEPTQYEEGFRVRPYHKPSLIRIALGSSGHTLLQIQQSKRSSAHKYACWRSVHARVSGLVATGAGLLFHILHYIN